MAGWGKAERGGGEQECALSALLTTYSERGNQVWATLANYLERQGRASRSPWPQHWRQRATASRLDLYSIYFGTMYVAQVSKTSARSTEKKKIKFCSYIRIFRWDQVQSHIWLTASSYMVKYLRISSYIRNPYLTYMTIPSEFPYIWGKFCFLFYQC